MAFHRLVQSSGLILKRSVPCCVNHYSRRKPKIALKYSFSSSVSSTRPRRNEASPSTVDEDVPEHHAGKKRPSQASLDRLWLDNYEKAKELMDQGGKNATERAPAVDHKRVAAWIAGQRYLYKQKRQGQATSLTDERVEKLERLLGMMEPPRDHSWQQSYESLKAFVDQHDGCFPHALDLEELDEEGVRLYHWCVHQRREWKKQRGGRSKGARLKQETTSMTAEREALLREIGFEFDLYDGQWMDRYRELEDYCRSTGNCMVPKGYVVNLSLGIWVHEQRYQRKLLEEGRRSSMTPERIRLLDGLDFQWSPREFQWMQKYRELELFVELNSYGALPRGKGHKGLRSWLLRQQKAFQQKLAGKDSSLTDERIALLQKLGYL